MIKRNSYIKHFVGLLAIVLLLGVGADFAQKPTLKRRVPVKKKVAVKPRIPVYKVDMGTIIRSRINGTISSKTAKVGDTFTATVTEPVYGDGGAVVAPTGSTVTGKVVAVTPAEKGGKPGAIDVDFISLKLPNGKVHAINGSLTDLTGKTSSDNEGSATGKKMEHRKIIFIGGGGAGGALLGAAIGGGKGALIGGLLGAGGGFLGDKLTKGPDAEVKSGTEFGVYLNQAISMPKFVETTPTNQ